MACWGSAGRGTRPRCRKRPREAARQARRGVGRGEPGSGSATVSVWRLPDLATRDRSRWTRGPDLGARKQAETDIRAQPLTAAVARLCMFGAAAAALLPPDAPDPASQLQRLCSRRRRAAIRLRLAPPPSPPFDLSPPTFRPRSPFPPPGPRPSQQSQSMFFEPSDSGSK